MIKPKLHKISLEPFILAVPASKVVFTQDMWLLRIALQREIDDTFSTWRGPALDPLPKTTQKMCRVWKRACRNEVYVF